MHARLAVFSDYSSFPQAKLKTGKAEKNLLKLLILLHFLIWTCHDIRMTAPKTFPAGRCRRDIRVSPVRQSAMTPRTAANRGNARRPPGSTSLQAAQSAWEGATVPTQASTAPFEPLPGLNEPRPEQSWNLPQNLALLPCQYYPTESAGASLEPASRPRTRGRPGRRKEAHAVTSTRTAGITESARAPAEARRAAFLCC